MTTPKRKPRSAAEREKAARRAAESALEYQRSAVADYAVASNAAKARAVELTALLWEARRFVFNEAYRGRRDSELLIAFVARIDAALAKPQDAPPSAPAFGHCIGDQWTAGYDAGVANVDEGRRGEARVFWCDTANNRHSCYCPKSPLYIAPDAGAKMLAEAEALLAKHAHLTPSAPASNPAAEQGRKPLTTEEAMKALREVAAAKPVGELGSKAPPQPPPPNPAKHK